MEKKGSTSDYWPFQKFCRGNESLDNEGGEMSCTLDNKYLVLVQFTTHTEIDISSVSSSGVFKLMEDVEMFSQSDYS